MGNYTALNWNHSYWDGDASDRNITEEEAIAKAKEMLGIYEIGGVEYRKGEMVEVRDNLSKEWVKRKFVAYLGNTIFCEKPISCYSIVKWNYIRKLTPQSLVGKTVKVKVDGKTYVAEIKEEK